MDFGLVNNKWFSLLSFRRILGSVDQALARRRRALKELQKQLKKSGSEKVNKIIFNVFKYKVLSIGRN